jgi:chromosome segregation ATPase
MNVSSQKIKPNEERVSAPQPFDLNQRNQPVKRNNEFTSSQKQPLSKSPKIKLQKPSTPEGPKHDNCGLNCSSIHNVSKHSLIDEDRDISLSKDKSEDSIVIDQKHQVTDSDEEKPKEEPIFKRSRIDESYTFDEVKEYISNLRKAHQSKFEAVIEKQMQKYRSLKEKRVVQNELEKSIKVKEIKLNSASEKEEYDLADKLQEEINKDLQKIEKIFRLMLNLDKQRSDLESQIKIIEIEFIKRSKEDMNTLIEIESRQTTEKNIYQKTQDEQIDDFKTHIRSVDIRIEETEKELISKIIDTEQKLSVIDEQCSSNAKEFIDQRIELEEEIGEVDLEIAELEAKLNGKIDQKHVLEELRVKAVKKIKQVNEEFDTEIDDLNEVKDKYERKKQVNNEKKHELDLEKQKLKQKEQEIETKIEEFKGLIQSFSSLTDSIKSKVKTKEKTNMIQHKLISEYEQKQEDFRQLVTKITQSSKNIKHAEGEISALDQELDDL